MNKIIHGDSLEVLKKGTADTIDCIVTDPPYGYSFMGKDWDKAVPSAELWKECLRVLKPGGFAFVMSAPRQDVLGQMIHRLGEAGFKTDFTSIYWTYASGFPKAMNIGKMVDKRMGLEPIDTGVPSSRHNSIASSDVINPQGKGGIPNITKPNSDQAKALDGSYGGFQPKPAVEVIIVAMKPLSEKTYVDQALKNGKGITWLDDCRIPTGIDENFGKAVDDYGDKSGGQWQQSKQIRSVPPEQGRFPANLLVSDDVLNQHDKVSKQGKPYEYIGNEYQVEGFIKDNKPQSPSNYNDSGSYSRYFDLDKFFKKLCETYPTRLESEHSDVGDDNVPWNNTAYTFPEYVLQRLYDNADMVVGSDVLGSSWRSFLHANDDEYGRLLKLLLDSPTDYLSSYHYDDVHARLSEGCDQELLQLLDGVHKQALLCLQSDGQDDNDVGIIHSYLISIAILPIIIKIREKINLPKGVTNTLPFLITPKASKREKNKGLEEFEEKNAMRVNAPRENEKEKTATLTKNNHPTVKPLKLMSYLITLGSREGDVILDPFCGSGTTCLAAKNLNRKYIGIESEEEYKKIAEARLIDENTLL